MQTTPERLTVETPRGPLAVARHGAGPPVTLVAGLGSAARLWGELPHLLGRRFTVFAVDNRGIGGSRSGARFTLDGAVEDLASVVAAAGLGPHAVLGASMGGLLAALLAARHPGAVRRLVLASCTARLTPSHGRVLGFFRAVLTHLPPAEAARALMAFAFAAPFADAYPGFVDAAARLWAPEPDDVPGALAQVEALAAGFDARAELARIATPCLVLAGALDPLVPAASTAEIAELVPGAAVRVVPGAAHSVLAEGGPALLEDVVGFLAG